MANGQWRLGSSGFSIDGRAQLEIDDSGRVYEQLVNDNDVFVYPPFRLLLSNDKAGIAAGPVLNSNQWLSTSQQWRLARKPDYYALAAPSSRNLSVCRNPRC